MNGEAVLTDAVLANLTNLSLTNISAFDFASKNNPRLSCSTECKVFPGDEAWPGGVTWEVFNLLTGLAVLKDVPLSSACYESWGNYNAEACAYITKQWSNVSLHISSPSDLMFPLWQGPTCLPPNITTNEPTGNCTVGGYPAYIVCLLSLSLLCHSFCDSERASYKPVKMLFDSPNVKNPRLTPLLLRKFNSPSTLPGISIFD